MRYLSVGCIAVSIGRTELMPHLALLARLDLAKLVCHAPHLDLVVFDRLQRLLHIRHSDSIAAAKDYE